MFDLLNSLLIQPLIEVYNVIFKFLYSFINEPVLTIMALSIVINYLSLPLYSKADQMQKEEIDKANKMRPVLDHIRKTFSGDERFMMESAYYKIEHYNPLSVLKEAGPLLLQVPFFIAAYRFISSLSLLEGAAFGPIQDLLKPDGLLVIAGHHVNVLPIIMTLINCISGFIYTKNSLLRQKIQVYGTALLFLFLLYESPSGLVIYWIMNNVFSLCKNIYSQHPIRLGAQGSSKKRQNIKSNAHVSQVLLAELCLALLLGFYIPSSVIVSSPTEFVVRDSGTLQSILLVYPALIYTGLLMIWMTVIILSREGKARTFCSVILWAVLGIALFNQFFAPAQTGTLYMNLLFDGNLTFSAMQIFTNLLLGFLFAAIIIFLAIKKPKIFNYFSVIISVTLLTLYSYNIWSINKVVSQMPVAETTPDDSAPITLSKTEKNVVVMMLDRAIGTYAPYIFDEKPELKESFRGFVYYPNTVSFGTHTNFGSPGLFGGYEYTPYESNKDTSKSLAQKQNEALKLMPVLFLNNGYQVTVCDPPYAGYQDYPDLSIYNDYPEIHAYNLTGKYSTELGSKLKEKTVNLQKRNFVYYSLFRVVPSCLKKAVYDDSNYLSDTVNVNYTQALVDSYSVLSKLSSLTEISETAPGNFLMFQNETPHNPTVLAAPDYAIDGNPISRSITHSNRVYDGREMKLNENRHWGHYCINVASYQILAEWLDYLKKEGVYDNTRIILVSDHGYYLKQFDDLVHPIGLDVESLNPLLMVKDFNSNDELKTDNTFMTNADVPTLAMKDVINNPVNPFTNVPVTDSLKHEGPVIVTDSNNWSISTNNGNTFELGEHANWWLVHDSIFDMNNWEILQGG